VVSESLFLFKTATISSSMSQQGLTTTCFQIWSIPVPAERPKNTCIIFSPTNPCEEATIRRNVDKTKETICSCLVKLPFSQLRRPSSRTLQRSISSPVSTKVGIRKRGN
jgi:hypothetical protein